MPYKFCHLDEVAIEQLPVPSGTQQGGKQRKTGSQQPLISHSQAAPQRKMRESGISQATVFQQRISYSSF